ncbi:SDR family NAD(P)-dependent oxidoreductase [Sphaerochaeta globosa]|uniref:3-oxoacyl-(Acyl-carrier-protein) reductase n=1 Tax=Sphaerochaeta globosa (strain ATCC BAA-1886 / DSM 22777 / Buddy) TaxID=158189 RepID=F0RSV1_SPHGB|nr:SDR family oxidoreductase [Sphaerochaeta globosa]ADY14001.1 3-oxoacyl-(acyl-carrier-protein) reductase [Sphaerochaeta globosa str. Buddy]
MKRFADNVLVVTGSAGDIGRAVALRFAREGAILALFDVRPSDATQAAVEAIGGEARSYRCDVTDAQSVQTAVNQVVSDFGKIDLLFNNAGYQGLFKKTHAYPQDDFFKVININLVGAFHVLRSVSEVMVKQGSGCIVNTASMAGVGVPPNMIAYGSSKAAIISMTKIAAKDLAPYGIRVNAISPAFMGPGVMWDRQVALQAQAGSPYYDSDPLVVEHQMVNEIPMHRLGDIKEIPGVVAFLMSDDASYITGENVRIAGGV